MRSPRVARWLMERLLDADAAEAIGGDLDEAFRARLATGRSPWLTRAWFWREAIVAVAWRWPDAAGSRARDAGQAGRRTMIDALWTDTRQTVRALRRSPGFSCGAIVPLALAVALATSVFTVVHAVLLRDLPYPRPDRLVVIGEHDATESIGTIGYETAVDFRERASSFDAISIVRGWGPTLTSPSTARLNGARVSSSFFAMLGVQPALGRDFTAADDTPDARFVVILSDALWRRQFNADPSIVNQTVELNETRFQVIGVMPPSFEPIVSALFYTAADIWAPLGYARGGDSACRSCRHLRAIGSVKAGVSQSIAQEELRGIHAGLVKQFPADYGAEVVSIERLSDRMARPMATPLSVLLAAVLLVLAIAGANAASLTLARASTLDHERALRAALGAGRVQLLRQRAIEALLLASAAGAVGLGGGHLLTSWLVANAPTTLPRADQIGLNASVLVFTVGAVLVIAALMVLLPSLRGLGRQLSTGSTPSRSTDSRALVRAREGLIVADVAIALLLTVGAGIMVRSLDRLLAVDPGFAPNDVQTVALSFVGPRWATDDAVRAAQRDIVAAVRALPGVDDVALTGQVPLGGNYDLRGGYLEERVTNRAEDSVDFQRYSVTPTYLQLMGIPLKRGRAIEDTDRQGTPGVMLVNETAARMFWPNRDAIGKRVTFDDGKTFVTVVGVVGDVRHYRLDDPPDPQMYRPQEQMTDSFLMMAVRTSRFDDVLPRIREAVAAVAPDVPLFGVRSMTGLVAASAATRRFTAELLGVFAVVAAVMTAAGLYGLVAYTVSRRTREFGIRMALGAPASQIGSLVLSRGLRLVVAGAAFGVAGSLLATRYLRDQMFETSPLDPAAIGAGGLVLLVVTAAAHVVPVARATRVSPTSALRTD